jgi:hypothetical protein
MGLPEPLKMRPSISSETGVFKTCRIKGTCHNMQVKGQSSEEMHIGKIKLWMVLNA